MSVNTGKTKIIVFRRGGGLKKYENWLYNGQKVSVTSFHSYLGVVFSWTGLWFQAQKALSEQASRALFSLTGCLNKFGTLPVDVALKIFDTKILPILLYGSEIWGFHPAPDVEKVYNKMLRFVLKLFKNTSTIALRGELGRVSMRVYRHCKIIKYWFRLWKMDKNILVFKCYEFQLSKIHVNRYDFWAKNVMLLLQT